MSIPNPATIRSERFAPPRAVPRAVVMLDSNPLVLNPAAFFRLNTTTSLDSTCILEFASNVTGGVPASISTSNAVAFPLRIILELLKFIFPTPSE